MDNGLAAMHRAKRLDERKAETSAFLHADMRTRALLEGLTEAAQIGFRDADARIRHADLDGAAVPQCHDRNFAAARRELDAIGEQVDENLLHRAPVAKDHPG